MRECYYDENEYDDAMIAMERAAIERELMDADYWCDDCNALRATDDVRRGVPCECGSTDTFSNIPHSGGYHGKD